MTTEAADGAAVDPWPVRRRLIFASIGLAQGIVIHLLVGDGRLWIADGAFRGALLIAACILPVLLYLTLDPRRWVESAAYGAGLAVTLAAAHFWIAWRLDWRPGALGPALWSSLAVTGIVAYVSLPFFQSWALTRKLRMAYADLFGHGWDNGLGVIAAGVFVGALWLLFLLWVGLFRLVGIGLFGRVFENGWFALPVSAAAFGLAMALLREQAGLVRSIRALVFALGRALAPVLPLAAVLFLVLLPFAGIEALWRTGHATALLLGTAATGLLLANLVMGSGGEGRPSPTVWWPVMAMLAVLPLHVALAAYATGMRIAQYGLTPGRVHAALLIAVAGIYAAAYFYAVLRHGSGWDAAARRLNPVLAAVSAGLALLAQTPAIDPYWLSARTQAARLTEGHVEAAEFDFGYLAYRLGAHGRRALAEIRADAGAGADPGLRAALAELDRSGSYREWAAWHGQTARARSQAVGRFGLLVDYVLVLPEGAALPPGFEDHLVHRQPSLLEWCHRAPVDRCAVVVADLSGDETPEIVLARRYDRRSIGFDAYRRADGRWRVYGYWQSLDAESIWRAMLQSDISTVAPDFRLLRLGDVTLPFLPRH